MNETHFTVLGLRFDATDAQIGDEYSRLKALYKGDQAYLRRLDEAYWVLSNPITRKQYVRHLKSQGVVDAPPTALSQDMAPNDSSSPGSGTVSETRKAETVSGQPVKRSTRQRTEFLDAAPSSQADPRILAEPGRGSTGDVNRRARQRTEFLDAKPESGSAELPQDQASVGRRQRTDYFDPHASQSPAAPTDNKKASAADAAHVIKSTTPTPTPADSDLAGSSQVIDTAGDSVHSPVAATGNKPAPVTPHAEVTVLHDGLPHDATVHHAIQTVVVEVDFRGITGVFTLNPGANLIGRPPLQGESPAIPLPDPDKYISRRHAVITWHGQHCTLIDQGSRNGTYLNNQRLQPQREYDLQNGDSIVIEERHLRISMT